MKIVACEECGKVLWEDEWKSICDVLDEALSKKRELNCKKIKVRFKKCEVCSKKIVLCGICSKILEGPRKGAKVKKTDLEKIKGQVVITCRKCG